MGDDFKDILVDLEDLMPPWYHPVWLLWILCLPFMLLEFCARGALKLIRNLADRTLSN